MYQLSFETTCYLITLDQAKLELKLEPPSDIFELRLLGKSSTTSLSSTLNNSIMNNMRILTIIQA